MDCEDPSVGVRDLRLKLQRKGLQPASKSGNGSVSGVRDLREKLSGTVNPQYRNADTSKPKSLPESVKQAKKSVAVDASVPESKKVSNPPRKKAQKKALIYFLCCLNCLTLTVLCYMCSDYSI